MSGAKGYRRWEQPPTPPPPPPRRPGRWLRRSLALLALIGVAAWLALRAGPALEARVGELQRRLAGSAGPEDAPAPGAGTAPSSRPRPGRGGAFEQPAASSGEHGEAAAAAAPRPWARASGWSELELGILAEMNAARTDPQRYLGQLEQLAALYVGKEIRRPGRRRQLTVEGVAAVHEAVAFLRMQAPLPALDSAQGLYLAARDHVADQGPLGTLGHGGSDGSQPAARIERHGEWLESCGENIAYASDTAAEVVMDLIVDDDVASRGHRLNIFSPAFKVVGVACGPHKGYRIMCVTDFAGGFADP